MPTPVKARWHIVNTFEQCRDLRKTAKVVRVTKKVASNWVERYRATRDVKEKPKSGRPQALSAEAKKRAYELLLGGQHSGAAGVAKQLYDEGLTPRVAHRTTVVRGATSYGKEAGNPIRCVRGKPIKKLTHATKLKRLAFARANTNTRWCRVLFTDMKKFCFYYPGAKVRAVEWVLKGSQRQAAEVNHPLTFNLYCGISKYGVTAHHQVSGTSKSKSTYKNKKGEPAKNITSSEYLDVVANTFLPHGTRMFTTQGMSTWVLQQDNDPTHRVAAEGIKKWNEKKGCSVLLMPNWPPNSPDLNPIENLWGIVTAKVNALGCKTFEEFKEEVVRELRSTPPEVLNNLIKSMTKRIKEVIKAEGDRINY